MAASTHSMIDGRREEEIKRLITKNEKTEENIKREKERLTKRIC